jgi:hypothetical protein
MKNAVFAHSGVNKYLKNTLYFVDCMVEDRIIAPQSPRERLAELERKVPGMQESYARGLDALVKAVGAQHTRRGGWGLFYNPSIDTIEIGAKLRGEAETLWGVEKEREQLRRELGMKGQEAAP